MMMMMMKIGTNGPSCYYPISLLGNSWRCCSAAGNNSYISFIFSLYL